MAAFGDERMHDRFEARERRRIGEHSAPEEGAIDNAVACGAWKSHLDRIRRLARIERMDHGIEIMNRDALVAKHRGGRRLAHADRPGKAENKHQSMIPKSCSLLDKIMRQNK